MAIAEPTEVKANEDGGPVSGPRYRRSGDPTPNS